MNTIAKILIWVAASPILLLFAFVCWPIAMEMWLLTFIKEKPPETIIFLAFLGAEIAWIVSVVLFIFPRF